MLRMWRWLRTHKDFNDLPDNHLVLEYDSSPNNFNGSPNDDLHARPALRTRIMLVPFFRRLSWLHLWPRESLTWWSC